ncbi:unnamed protein product, partial [Candidula unifasciata]
PPRKYLHEKADETYQACQHELTNMQEVADAIVRYDLDDQDVIWLQLVNDDREEMGLQLINEWNLERMIEELENQCYIKTNALKKTEEGLGIEYDEDVACDVCRMLESEDTNEMVFCDGCDICVHQACYGIQTIPEGSWLCRICALGIKPMCLLCPKRGGAMKSTKSGTKWTHVSCALWIPEVSIGCPEKMEPITKISNIPPSRWALVCCLCKERVGACIQCSVKQCKTAFHVTCGFAHNLDMKTIVDDSDDADGIHLRAYCPKHTKNQNASESESPKKEDLADNENDVSEAEMAKKRSEKLKQLEEEFYTLVDTHEIATKFFIPEEAVDIVTEYWKLKRKVNKNKPLITPKMEEEDQMQKQQQDSLSARMKMFVHLRQDLERARNLCYMISKREKNKRQLFKLKEGVFHAQIRVLTDPDLNLSAREAEKVRQDYYFDSIYSDYGAGSARSNSRQPRENLFTLENLKTPKDFDESSDELSKRGGKISHKSVRLGKSITKKDVGLLKGYGSLTASASTSDKSTLHKRGNIFSEGLKILTDSTAESSEEESLATLAKTTQSSQMSRLGKVKLKEIEEKGSDGEPGDVRTFPESPTKKFVPSSDLRKKLTSILQSKNMMHQRQEKMPPVLSKSVTGALHVDVENSDSDMFTSDTNTDLVSPADQPRNLFDQFKVQGKPILSSPEIQSVTTARSRSHYRKYKIKKHIRRHKKSRLQLLSSSDQSNSSSTTNKPESAVSGAADIASVRQTSHLLSDDTDHDVSSLSPTLTADASDVDCHSSSHPFSTSQLQSGKGKKRKLHRDLISLEPSGKSLHVLDNTMPQLSPSPRVNPRDIYSTIDGDIYVPSGKIQITERTIILDDPVEEKRPRPRSKLRLKKQANSPVKGIISYEVVKDNYDRHDANEDVKPKSDAEEKRNIFDSVLDKDLSEAEIIEKKSESELPSFSPRSLRKHKKQEDVDLETPDKKISDSYHPESVAEVKTEVEYQNDCSENDIHIESRQKRTRSRSLLPTSLPADNDAKGASADENFKPRFEPSRVSPPHTRRSRTSRQSHTDETDGEDGSEDFRINQSRKKCSYTRMSTDGQGGRGVVLTSVPNKLAALHDSRQLIVKDDVKKRVIANLDKIIKGRSRWRGNGFVDRSQTSIDRFVKRTNSSENVFSKPDVIKDPHAKRVSSQPTRHDLTPLQVNKSSSPNTPNDRSFSSKLSVSSPIKAAPRDNVFGAHTSSRNIFNNYRIPRKVDSSSCGQNATPTNIGDTSHKTGDSSDKTGDSSDKTGDSALFGDLDKLQSPGPKEQLSFEDVSRNADLAAVVKTPPKCDPAGLNEDKLDGNRSYRSQSPPSSEGSGASSRILQLDSREGTPSRRITRSHIMEDAQSPGTRSRTREGFLKASQLKFS